MIPTFHECRKYFYDAEAGDRVIRFIETFCTHYEGRHAGQPFKLLDWQKQLVRTIFGWKHRKTGLRRFREVYLISAKGSGKTPLLTAIGLYLLLADGEAGAHVISMASGFEQAKLTFDAAKKYIQKSKPLARRCRVLQFEIKAPKDSKWNTISGRPDGRSGPRPSCVIADECHEWPAYTAKAFDMLCANLFKRSQPLLLIATNAGPDKQCFAWSMHERAMRVQADPSIDEQFLPVIFEAPEKINGVELDWKSEDAAQMANPSMGKIVGFDQIKPEQVKGEARYRRLYLAQWVTGFDKWLDMAMWSKCERELLGGVSRELPCYIGLDLSTVDDLCAAVFSWVTEEMFYVDSHFWLPKATAYRYFEEQKIAYPEWAERGGLTLIEENTITPAVMRRIASEIAGRTPAQNIKAVCYDRYKANDCIAKLEEEGITCVPIAQGYTVSPGCAELDRRLKDMTIAIAPNDTMRFCASNVEVTYDHRGNYWPVKPNAKGKYAGTMSRKIDGISSLVTLLVEARKHTFPKKKFKGSVSWE